MIDFSRPGPQLNPHALTITQASLRDFYLFVLPVRCKRYVLGLSRQVTDVSAFMCVLLYLFSFLVFKPIVFLLSFIVFDITIIILTFSFTLCSLTLSLSDEVLSKEFE